MRPRREATELPSKFKRQVVSFATHEAPGTLVIDTPNTFLYLVLGNGRALRYGIGREGFTWAGTKTVEKKAEWRDWRPPQEMIERQPYLPRFMAGGPATRWAPAPCISPSRSIASRAPTRRTPSASGCPRAASA
jgi:lipoprotein-anchoring transpeptidase ErfK/SrfK